MCCSHVIMCCCSASSDSVSETFTSRHKGWVRRGECGERKVRVHHFSSFFMGCKTCPSRHRLSLSSLPLFSLFLFCVNDFHEKALNKISHLRNTSVRWCQRLAYSSSCWVASMAFSHVPGMLTWSSGESQTQVGSSWKNRRGPSVLSWALEGMGRIQKQFIVPAAMSMQKRGMVEIKKRDSKQPPVSCRDFSQDIPSACPVGDICLRISRNSDLTLTLNIFGTGWKCLIWTCKNISGTEGQRLKFRVKINTWRRKGNSEVKDWIKYEPLSSLTLP